MWIKSLIFSQKVFPPSRHRHRRTPRLLQLTTSFRRRRPISPRWSRPVLFLRIRKLRFELVNKWNAFTIFRSPSNAQQRNQRRSPTINIKKETSEVRVRSNRCRPFCRNRPTLATRTRKRKRLTRRATTIWRRTMASANSVSSCRSITARRPPSPRRRRAKKSSIRRPVPRRRQSVPSPRRIGRSWLRCRKTVRLWARTIRPVARPWWRRFRQRPAFIFQVLSLTLYL